MSNSINRRTMLAALGGAAFGGAAALAHGKNSFDNALLAAADQPSKKGRKKKSQGKAKDAKSSENNAVNDPESKSQEADDKNAGKSEKGLPMVDTHQHLWDLKKVRLPWIKDAKPLARNFVMSDYVEATKGLNIAKTVYMEVDVDPRDFDVEAAYVLDLCERKDNPMAGAVLGGRPASPDFRKYVERYKGHKYVKGIRQVIHNPSSPTGYCLGKEFIAGVRLLGELGLRFDICIRPDELGDALKLVEACPDTRFILDHCGNASSKSKDLSDWKRGMSAIAAKKNVVGKVSGQIDKAPEGWTAETLAPIINHTLESFGPDRVMFGGDWPVCTLGGSFRSWTDALLTIVKDRPLAEQRKLLHDNAVRFYELS